MTTERLPATDPADSPAARLRLAVAQAVGLLAALYLTLQPRDLRRSIPTVSRALGWDWSRLGPDLVDRLDDESLRYLVATSYDRLAQLIEIDERVADLDAADSELRARVLDDLRRALA